MLLCWLVFTQKGPVAWTHFLLICAIVLFFLASVMYNTVLLYPVLKK